jgi:DNA-binding CsgD family transcriptional regulator/tetratricopeptide (TPR) repeat protein
VASPLQLSAPLVGRDRELDELVDTLGLAAGAPRRSAVLVAGDAGVGKTRLLAELVDRARRAGWRHLVGHCLDFGGGAPPYLAFSELFGELSRTDPEAARALLEQHPALERLQPGRRQLGGRAADASTGDPEVAAVPSLHPDGLGQGELVDAVHGALDTLAASGPLLVVVEDVHWADRSTRDLLTLLFTRPFRHPIAVVASYRTDDLHRRHPLRSSVAEWVRLPGVHRVQLPPLADDDVRRLLQSLHRGLPPQDVHRIVARAGGNAFFAEELLAAGLGDGRLPDDLTDLLLVRLDRLQDPARDVVRAAAVAGREVAHSLLAAVVDLPDDVLDQAIRDAVEQHVLVGVEPVTPAAGESGYAFRHALLAEAVYDDLLPGERVRVHAAYAAALGEGRVEGTAAELARHASAAHDLDTALRASVQAGDDALTVGGPGDAARHYGTALELLADPRRPAPSDIDVVALVERAADAIVGSGRPEKARTLVLEHLRELPADADADAAERARLLLAYALATLMSEYEDEALAATTEAVELLPDEPSGLRARVLDAHARAHLEHGRHEEATRFATEALGMGRQLDLPALVSDASTTLARIEEWTGNSDAARQTLDEVIERARATGDTEAEIRGRYLLGQLHHEAAELAEAEPLFLQSAQLASTSGRPWSPYGFSARLFAALTRYERGDWDGAVATADPLAPDGSPGPVVATALFLGVRMAVAAGRGDGAAAAMYEQVRPAWDKDGLVGILSAAALIDLHGDAGRIDDAVGVHDEVVRVVGAMWSPQFQARVRLSALLLGQLASAAGTSPGGARASLAALGPPLLETVEAVQHRMGERRRPFGPEGVAWVRRAHAEGLRLGWLADVEPPDFDELVGAWQQAVTAFDQMGHAFELARSQARLGAVLVAAGDGETARPLLDSARAAATRLGAGPLLAELERVSPTPARRPSPRADHAPGGPLTPRETEIVALVAEGRSNGEIARALFISTKTVSVHVSNILAKLGAASRTEAAAIARRTGLL